MPLEASPRGRGQHLKGRPGMTPGALAERSASLAHGSPSKGECGDWMESISMA